MNGLHSLYPLKGVVQHYSWGGFDFIPDLLKTNNEDKKPFAEYWLGTHPNCPSAIVTPTGEEKLDQFIQKNDLPSLPFLLKVLDVRQMLSIQVHPDKTSAQKGFEEENKKGVPHNAPHRNYKDTNHKPELMVALSDFWLLHGFKNESELRKTLESIQEFHFLIEIFQRGHYKALYEHVMKMEQESINAVLQPLIDRILPLYRNDQLQKNDPGFWAVRAIETFCKKGELDRGIFSIYFFNLLFLKKGEGIYQPSELPHAYLEGQNIEIMANSDNVLRAGLTDKHIDIEELMRHIKFEPTHPFILQPSSDTQSAFTPPVEEFELYQYNLTRQEVLESKSAEIWIVTKGQVEANDNLFDEGGAFFVLPQQKLRMIPNGEAILFRACVPNRGKN